MVGTCHTIAAIRIVETATGITFPNLMFIIMLIGAIIWYAKDWETGSYYLFFMSAMGFVGFYQWGCVEYVNFLYLMLIALIIMSLTLYTMSKAKSEGSLIA